MGPRLRKLMLTFHVAASVGWFGAIVAYIPLDVTAATSGEVSTLRAVYVAMDLVADWVLVPLALLAWASGVIVSLGSRWGLFRHYWVLTSLILTTLAVAVLLVEARVIGDYATVARDAASSAGQIEALGNTLLHSVGGLGVVAVVFVLNMYKPQGLTKYGWRRQHQPHKNRGQPTNRSNGRTT